MDTVQWPQEIVVKSLEEVVINTTATSCPKPNLLSSSPSSAALDQRKQRPEKDQALNCPRCNSTNTKFCYYNNYSLTQPRYFCKACRRYWTAGGSLRNIPVGGGSRKNKRSASTSSSSSKSMKLPDLVTHQNPKIEVADHQGNVSDCWDLNLGFPETHQISALELITGVSSRGLNSFMPMSSGQDPNGMFGSGYDPMHELNLKPLSFAMDGLGSGFSGLEEGNGSVLFPFEDLKQVSTSTSNNSDVDQQSNKQGHDSSPPGYWTGILGGSW